MPEARAIPGRRPRLADLTLTRLAPQLPDRFDENEQSAHLGRRAERPPPSVFTEVRRSAAGGPTQLSGMRVALVASMHDAPSGDGRDAFGGRRCRLESHRTPVPSWYSAPGNADGGPQGCDPPSGDRTSWGFVRYGYYLVGFLPVMPRCTN
ncbi:hypothetical protein GCM10018773_39140 [Streptomyces candidus]|nr:hypothetical protein GCM10018773_39140 [Streptomyces candidus]